MPAHQTEHGFKFASRLEHPFDGSQQENLHGFASVFVLRSTEEVVQDVGYPLYSIPLQAVQIVPDGMITVLVGNDADSRFDFLFAGNAVLLHSPQDILHVSVVQRLAGAGPAHRLYNVNAFTQKVQPDASASTWSFCKIVMQFWIVRWISPLECLVSISFTSATVRGARSS